MYSIKQRKIKFVKYLGVMGVYVHLFMDGSVGFVICNSETLDCPNKEVEINVIYKKESRYVQVLAFYDRLGQQTIKNAIERNKKVELFVDIINKKIISQYIPKAVFEVDNIGNSFLTYTLPIETSPENILEVSQAAAGFLNRISPAIFLLATTDNTTIEQAINLI